MEKQIDNFYEETMIAGEKWNTCGQGVAEAFFMLVWHFMRNTIATVENLVAAAGGRTEGREEEPTRRSRTGPIIIHEWVIALRKTSFVSPGTGGNNDDEAKPT